MEPAESNILPHAALPYFEAGRVDEAISYWREVIKLDPSYWAAHNFLARAFIKKGMYQEAIAELRKSTDLRNPGQAQSSELALMAGAHALAGQRTEALKIVNDLERRAASGETVALHGMAFAYVGLGDKDKALAWLEKGYERRGSGMFFLNCEPLYDRLRSDPRFQDLVQRIFYPTEQNRAPVASAGETPVRSPAKKSR